MEGWLGPARARSGRVRSGRLDRVWCDFLFLFIYLFIFIFLKIDDFFEFFFYLFFGKFLLIFFYLFLFLLVKFCNYLLRALLSFANLFLSKRILRSFIDSKLPIYLYSRPVPNKF